LIFERRLTLRQLSQRIFSAFFGYRLSSHYISGKNQITPMSKDRNHYYHAEDLKKFTAIGEFGKELADKFFDYYGAVFAEGALTAREKSLIALAVAHAVQCPYCIDAYATDATEKGCSENQMMEAVHVAAAIRGGASLVHGVQMMNKVKDISM
jgi:alkylhydroperoxidase/carboxymuconolactone decarboxylase family protein